MKLWNDGGSMRYSIVSVVCSGIFRVSFEICGWPCSVEMSLSLGSEYTDVQSVLATLARMRGDS